MTPGTNDPPRSSKSIRSSGELFDLPKKIRNIIYRWVLVVAHPIYLFQDSSPRIETFAPERPRRWLALLHTNRQVNDEASAILYGGNRYFLVEETQRESDLLRCFLNGIGAQNAAFLSHLCINFPVIRDQAGALRLTEGSLRDLKLLQQRCTDLSTLELFCFDVNSCGLAENEQTNSAFISEALSQIDVELKAIHSVNRIVVRISGIPPSPSLKESMEAFGWAVLPAYSNHW